MADEIKDSAKKEPRSYMHLRIVSAEKNYTQTMLELLQLKVKMVN